MSLLRNFNLLNVLSDAFKNLDRQYPVYTESENNGHVCVDNSTSTPLGISGVFTGAWQDTINYNTITIGIIADQDSAIDGLVVQWSHDGASVTQDDVFTILANSGKVFTFSPANRYVRVVYTNGGVEQTSFNIQTIFKKGGFKASSHRINDSIIAEDDAELVKSVITGQDVVSNAFVNVGTVVGQVGNNLLVSVDQVEDTTNSLKTISYSHAELHGGNHYFVNGWHSIARAGTKDHLIITPNTTRWAHMTLAVEAVTSQVTVSVYEDATVSANGTLANSRNRNRNFPDNNTTLIYEDPTVITVGNVLPEYILGAGKGSSGGAIRDSEEIILKQNTIYLVRVVEANIAATDVNFKFDWYEHTNL